MIKKIVSKLALNTFFLLDELSGTQFLLQRDSRNDLYALTTHQIKILAFIVSQPKDNLDCFIINKEAKVKCAEAFNCSVDSVSVAMTGLVKLGVIFKMGNSSYSVNKTINYYDTSNNYEFELRILRI